MRALLVAVLAFGLAGCGPTVAEQRAEKNKADKVTASPKSTPPPAKVSRPTTRPAVTKQEPPSPKPDGEQFADDWAAAWKLAEAADREESDQTRRALAILTIGERQEAALSMGATGDSLFQAAPRLASLGLSGWVARESRKFAREQDAFKNVARAFWRHQKDPATILGAANVWGTLDPSLRGEVDTAVDGNLQTISLLSPVRDAILALGGRGWLEKH